MRVAVIGCGILGVKIAGTLAYHGHRVKVYDSDTPTLNHAYTIIEEDKNMLRQEGLLLQKNFLGSIYYLSRLQETVSDADFIIEAVCDDLEVKQNLFQSISQMCKPDAVIATNSLKFHISDIAKTASKKEQMIGLRFLFPVYYIPEVEITLSQQTSPETIEKGRKFLEKMGKTLFFRSGGEPLILKEEEREMRKQLRLEQIKNSFGMTHFFKKVVPKLGHDGNENMSQEGAQGMPCHSGEQDCAICMASPRDCLLCPCHHLVTCYTCSSMLLSKQDGCPICRKDITEIVKVYHS
ncbi:uncharacterized protein LOC115216963 [Argonauta hians]